jgi:carbamoyltransferase
MLVMGVSGLSHDAAACLLRDGVLVAAAEEERFSRKKHDPSMPKRAVQYCLRHAGVTIKDLDRIAYSEVPEKKMARRLWTLLPNLNEEACVRACSKARRVSEEIRTVLGYEGEIEFVDHHLAHAASAFCYSGFDEAAIMTIDGVGEWVTTSYSRGCDGSVSTIEEVHLPHSIGLFYSAITSYLGFEVNDGEYKVMGLAPYGAPKLKQKMEAVLHSSGGGQFVLDTRFIDLANEERCFTEELIDFLGFGPRMRREQICECHKDLARSAQEVVEDLLIEKSQYLFNSVNSRNLCLAGGVAMNCVANGKILRNGPFRRMYVPAAAGDQGACLGAAAVVHHRLIGGGGPQQSQLADSALGPEYSSDEIGQFIAATSVRAEDFRGKEDELIETAAQMLADGEVIGWFHGRMEFGPRALGNRSILADPRDAGMQDRINEAVKKRERFRPFAPAVLEGAFAKYFEMDGPSPFMTVTCAVKTGTNLPSVTHVDGSARLQTVDEKVKPRFARLLKAFEAKTGYAVVLNTSFNMNNEPIVNSPADALRCFTRSGLDVLILEDWIIKRDGLSAGWRSLCAADPEIYTPVVSDSVYASL